MSVCTKCWCWSYVFSALGFFSYCLPALFGPSSSQPVCYFLSLLRDYIFVSLLHHRTNRETPWLACTSNFFYVACAVGFSYFIICKLCSSPHGFLCVLCVTVVLSYFSPLFCYILSQFWVELRHGCLQASVENIMKEKMPKKGGRWWFSWRSKNSDIKPVCTLISRHNCSQQFSFLHYLRHYILYIYYKTVQHLPKVECFIN